MLEPGSIRAEGCPFCYPDPRDPHYNWWSIPVIPGIRMIMSVGMIVPGNLLVVPDDHFTSMAMMPMKRLELLDAELQPYERHLSERFAECIRVEHGSDNIETYGSGACIDHAHALEFPVGEAVADYMLAQLPWQKLGRYRDLIDLRGAPYIYLGWRGEHYAVADPKLPSQWARKMVAEVLGEDADEEIVYDWPLRPNGEFVCETVLSGLDV